MTRVLKQGQFKSRFRGGVVAVLLTSLVSSALVSATIPDHYAEPVFYQPELLEKTGDLVAELRDEATDMIVRARSVGSATARYKAKHALTQAEVEDFEKRALKALWEIPGAPSKSKPRIATNAPNYDEVINEYRFQILNAMGAGIHLLLSVAQIRALTGRPLDPVRPTFLTGSEHETPFGLSIRQKDLAEIFVFNDSFHSDPKFPNPVPAYANSSYGTNSVQNLIEYVPDEFDPEMVILRPRGEILSRVAVMSQLNRPTETAFTEWTRDMVLLALTGTITEQSYRLGGDVELATWRKRVETLVLSQAVPGHLGSRIQQMMSEHVERIRSELWAAAMWARVIKKWEQTPALAPDPLNEEQAEKYEKSKNELLNRMAGVYAERGAEELASDTLRDYTAQHILEWFIKNGLLQSSNKRDERIRAAITAVKYWNWKEIIPTTDLNSHIAKVLIETQRMADRSEWELGLLKAAKTQYPIWQAVDRHFYKKDTPIPDSALKLRVIPGVLKDMLAADIAALGLSNTTAQASVESEGFDAPYLSARQAIVQAAAPLLEIVKSNRPGDAFTARDVALAKKDLKGLDQIIKWFGFDQNTEAPMLKSLSFNTEQQLAYLKAYLNYSWDQNTILSPQVSGTALGSLLKSLSEVNRVDEAHDLLYPAVKAKLQAAVETFSTVANAKGAEDLAHFMFRSPYIQDVLKASVPGVKALAAHWQRVHARKNTGTTWQKFTESYGQPAWMFLGMMATEFLFKGLGRPLVWAGTRMGMPAEALAFVSPHNGLVRGITRIHQTASAHFSQYFMAYLGIMAVNIGEHANDYLTLARDAGVVQKAYFAQGEDTLLFRHKQVNIAKTAASVHGWSFVLSDIVFNIGIFFTGPLVQKLNGVLFAGRESMITRHWVGLGVRSEEMRRMPDLWKQETIDRLLTERIRTIEIEAREAREAAQANASKAKTAQETLQAEQQRILAEKNYAKALAKAENHHAQLTELLARDTEYHGVAARAFEGSFRDLHMKNPSFKMKDIEAAYSRVIAEIRKQLESSKATGVYASLLKGRLELQAVAAEHAYTELKQFANMWALTFTVGPFTRKIYKDITSRDNANAPLRRTGDLEYIASALRSEPAPKTVGRRADQPSLEPMIKSSTPVKKTIGRRSADDINSTPSDPVLNPREDFDSATLEPIAPVTSFEAEIAHLQRERIKPENYDIDSHLGDVADRYAFAMARSLEARGQSIFGFWESGVAPRTRFDGGGRSGFYLQPEAPLASLRFSAEKDYYAVLGLDLSATNAEIEAAYMKGLGSIAHFKPGALPSDRLDENLLREAYVHLMHGPTRTSYDLFRLTNPQFVEQAQATRARVQAQEKKALAKKPAEPLSVGSTQAEWEARAGVRYYRDLGVKPGATQQEMDQALQDLRLHLRKNPHPENEADFRKALEAYRLLSNPGFKAWYDIAGREAQARASGLRNKTIGKVPTNEPNGNEGGSE